VTKGRTYFWEPMW